MQANSHYGRYNPGSYDSGNFRPRHNNSGYHNRRNPPNFHQRQSSPSIRFKAPPSCPLCQQAGRRNFDHKLYSCPFLLNDYKGIPSKARLIESFEEQKNCYENSPQEDEHYPPHYPPTYPTYEGEAQ